MITASEGHEWRQWVLITSIPLLRLGEDEQIVGLAAGAMMDHAGHRFILAVEHAVKRETSGWAIAVQQDGQGRLEFYRPNGFAYVAEFKRSTASVRCLDLCLAEVSADLETWYEYRTHRELFDKRLHHVFRSDEMTNPEANQIYGFSGQVRHERHGTSAVVSDMVVYPGLKFSHTEDEVHHFRVPVPHPGHEAFKGCSGAPIVDLNQRIVALVVGGDTEENTVKGIAIQRALFGIQALASRRSGT